MPYSAGPYQQMQQGPCLNLHQAPMSGNNTDREGNGPSESLQSASCISHTTAFYSSIVASGNAIPGSYNEKILPSKYTNDSTQPLEEETSEVNNSLGIMNDPTVNGYGPAEKLDHGINRFCNIHFIVFQWLHCQ
ncbi:hypothetical protein HN51_063626 [Arachis hypogaea]